ncbi:cytochrome P450 76C4 [Citrus sinensis]|uniref:Cytochrome P450 n=1 Tax=Citrus sinensis TaxID=2711 RepID=A0A067DPV6_CITSI|nr:cytochrome P450 76C4 [Citrus sinensis]KDO41057.1 hypothetical protein CISIN_1g043641mg [Citrus sinensis]
MEILISCVLWLLFTWVWVITLRSFSKGSRKLPPGPTPLPIIGNLLELGQKPHKSLADLAKVHGPIMSLQFGQVTTVVISSAAMAKQVLQDHDTSLCNRNVPESIRSIQKDEYGIPWLPVSTKWKKLRKICNLHIFTSQKLDANQDLRPKKIQQLVAFVQDSCRTGEPSDVGQAAFDIVVNFLSNTIFSIDLADPNSDSAREFKDSMWGLMVEAKRPNLSDFFPMLRKLDIQGVQRRITRHTIKILEVLDRFIDQRLEQRQQNSFADSKDMLDTLLNISESEDIDRNDIKFVILAVTELLNNPEALSKARLELEQKVGKGNLIEESDITQLPYLQIIVKETLRLHPPVPLLLPRKASADVEITGFIIPKGAQVLVNAWAIGRDTSTWDDPYSFKLERFLGSDVDVKGRNFELFPFGAGRRICLGLPLAIRMLYLMLGSLIKSFDWKLDNKVTSGNVDMEEKFGITLQKAQPLHVVPIAI